MAEKAKKDKEQYRQARDEFDSLNIEEKAIFLVESTFSMLAHGIEAFGAVFSEQINKVYQEEGEEEEEKASKTPPKARKTTTRKTAARKTAARKTTTRKTASEKSTSTRTRKTNPKSEE